MNESVKRKTAAPGRGRARSGSFETSRFYTNRLSLLNRLIARTTKQMLAEIFGLSQMEWRVLIQLEYRSPSKVFEIHERSLFQKAQISSALQALIRRGYVVRYKDPLDARAPNFCITDEGLRAYRSIMRISRKRQRGLESLLEDEQRKAFDAAIDRLMDFFLEDNKKGGDGMFGKLSSD